MAGTRITRLTVVLFAGFVTVFLVAGFYRREAQAALGHAFGGPAHTGLSLAAVQPRIQPDAHRLLAADDFLPHLKAVVAEWPGLTVHEAKRTCQWGPDDSVDFQYGPEIDWVNEDKPDAEIEMRRREWHSFVGYGGLVPYSEVRGRFSGRGLVIVAGNGDTLKRVKVVLRALVRLRSTIAVEIHYWDDEMKEGDKKNLTSLYPDVRFNDLSGEHNILTVKKDGFFGINYQLKSAALVNSHFAEPLLLDSDNIPVIDPALMYNSTTYRDFGTIFWPDIARTRANNPAWAIFNTPCRMDEYEQESGQLLVDKTRFWYHLQLAAWINNVQGPYYSNFLLGDKDAFRFAWHALKTQYGAPKRWLASVGTLNDGVYCGHSFAQHQPDADDGRVAFMHGGLLKSVDPKVLRWNRDVKGGYFREYKRAPADEDPAVNVNVGIGFDSGEYAKPSVGGDVRAAMCTDMYDVEARDLNEYLPGFEQVFREIGGYWMLDDVKS